MIRYEYIRLEVDMGNLTELNGLASSGWHVVAIVDEVQTKAHGYKHVVHYALLERPLPGARP